MLTRYSHSPVLRLEIANSGYRRLLIIALYLCVACALFCMARRGYSWLALLLLPLAVLCSVRLWRLPFEGAVINWRRGQWSIDRYGTEIAIRVHRSSTCLPALVYLAWVELPTGRKQGLCLFRGSVAAAPMRYLRVRLRLER